MLTAVIDALETSTMHMIIVQNTVKKHNWSIFEVYLSCSEYNIN